MLLLLKTANLTEMQFSMVSTTISGSRLSRTMMSKEYSRDAHMILIREEG